MWVAEVDIAFLDVYEIKNKVSHCSWKLRAHDYR